MHAQDNIVIMGLRGSGKSSVTPLIAAGLGRALVDLDDITVAVIGTKSVPEAWSRFGKDNFRAAEAAALRAALTLPGKVIALGGGTPMAPGAADLLRAARASRSARIIYLRASAETLHKRLAAAEPFGKPAVTLENPAADIASVLAQRDPLYSALADHVIDVDHASVQNVVERVVAAITDAAAGVEVKPPAAARV